MKFGVKNRWFHGLLGVAALTACGRVDETPGGKADGNSETTKVTVPSVDYTGGLSDQDKQLVVATINGESVTQGELYNEVGGQLLKMRIDMVTKEYGAKKRALEELVDERLLDAEAKKRGVTVDALLKVEVEDKLPVPTDADLEQVFRQLKRRLPPDATLESHRTELTEAYQGRKKAEARMAFVKTLRDQNKVEFKLPYPDIPAVPVSMDDDPIKGNKDAPIKIIEWSDFQCPYCQKNVPILKKIESTYGDKVVITFRDYPLPFHDKAQKAAQAAQCSHEQGKYWEYHDQLFANQNKLDIEGLKSMAAEMGMDSAKFNECLDSGKYKSEVEKDMADGQVAGVTGTPAVFINGKMVSGAQPFENFAAIIDSEVAKLTSAPH